jgi:hypothetical protein
MGPSVAVRRRARAARARGSNDRRGVSADRSPRRGTKSCRGSPMRTRAVVFALIVLVCAVVPLGTIRGRDK